MARLFWQQIIAVISTRLSWEQHSGRAIANALSRSRLATSSFKPLQ
jgi:hypothetical protein